MMHVDLATIRERYRELLQVLQHGRGGSIAIYEALAIRDELQEAVRRLFQYQKRLEAMLSELASKSEAS